MENNQQSFWQFSDQLRVHNSNLANLSLNDSIWSNSNNLSKRPDERRNFDVRVGGEAINNTNSFPKPKNSDLNGFSNDDWKLKSGNSVASPGFNINSNNNNINTWKTGSSDLNGFNSSWKMGSGPKSYDLGPISQVLGGVGSPKNVTLNGGFNKGIYPSKGNYNVNNNLNVNVKGYKNKGEDEVGVKPSNKKNGNKKFSGDNNDGKDTKSGGDKRFKTLPPTEALPRNETVGGYIFVCNNDTMQENLKRQLFGLPPRYRDSVRAITPGLPLFLYNYSTHQLHGVFEAASFGGTNIDPAAWEDKKCHGESRFPAQVRVVTRKICEPLEEDSFRPILHHYDGPKFRLELNIPEALSLLDIFEEQNA
ncbi:B2 protein [Mercurialis annua]|uniref:B2 protein n=1 Tax=Mercurialis annua TaxID=3986 RepID=UPI00215FCFE0|nr:B2 protein [Mercurialis annua]